jgi:hypothetical protein
MKKEAVQVEIYLTLGAACFTNYKLDLALSLHNLASRLSDIGGGKYYSTDCLVFDRLLSWSIPMLSSLIQPNLFVKSPIKNITQAVDDGEYNSWVPVY